MSRRGLPSWTIPFSWACLVAWAVAMALALAGCSSVEPVSAWPESAEFSTLETGQDRWSTHLTGAHGLRVIVDHSTGAQYLYAADAGLCPLLDVDGTPLLVLEAG